MDETKDSHASFVLSNILRSSITLRIPNHEPIVKKQLTAIPSMIALLFSFSTTTMSGMRNALHSFWLVITKGESLKAKAENAEGCNPKAFRIKGTQAAAILAVH